MEASNSIISGIAKRLPAEFSDGLDIGLDIVEHHKTTGRVNDADSLGDALSEAAHRVARQKVCLQEETSSVATCVTLLGADSVIQEYFQEGEDGQ